MRNLKAVTRLLARLDEWGRFWRFNWQVLFHGLFHAGAGRRSAGRARIWAQMYEIGNKSVPVVMITGAFVGMTLAVQSYQQFKGAGLEERLGSLINITVVKELGPVLAAMMLAGRVGGALTAELGTMHVTEQIDALRAMGADPIKHLVVPRFWACVLLTPCLTIYADFMGVLGGYLITVCHFGVNSNAYWYFSAHVVEKWDILIGLIKGVFFGAVIALIGCFKGFDCQPGAHGVGKACTEAFVNSFLTILALDFALAVIFKGIYETIWGLRIVL
ncbi:MAG: ABC transporter permease [Sedimentisphaerales bacterium]|nr:ABC transporter permease [Sedimentisphaerales bacterium]